MKYLKPYTKFKTINESLKDHLLPKSDEEIKKGIQGLTQSQKNKMLMYSSQFGHTNEIKLLIDVGADVNNGIQLTEPLEIAAARGHIGAVKMLLNHGADVHADKEYPLRAAYSNGHTEIVKLLLDYGAHESILKDLKLKL